MTTAEAAAYSKRGHRMLRNAWKSGALKAAVIGGKRELMFRREWIDGWIESLTTPVMVTSRRPR